MSADAADARIEVSKKGPGIGVREGSADSSWLVLDKNEDGRIVEGNVAVDGEAAVNSAQDKKRPEDQSNDDARDKTDGSPETSEQESGGERTETDNGAGKIKCEVGERVQHSKYRYGVVRWLGEVGGEKMAGVELVGSQLSLLISHIAHLSPSLYVGELYRWLWKWVFARL